MTIDQYTIANIRAHVLLMDRFIGETLTDQSRINAWYISLNAYCTAFCPTVLVVTVSSRKLGDFQLYVSYICLLMFINYRTVFLR